MALLTTQDQFHSLSLQLSAGLCRWPDWKGVLPASSSTPKTVEDNGYARLKGTKRDTGYRSVSPLARGYRPDKYDHCGYLSKALQRDEIEDVVDMCVKELKGRKFDTIAFRGLSGTLIAPIVAHILKKEIIVIRKREPGSSDHSGHRIEGHVAAKRYVILDDFIAGGNTVKEIIKGVEMFAPGAKLWGGIFYTNWKTWLTPKTLRARVKI